ncbi:glycerol-3-phosphate acyltransferase 1-like [Vigna umbellata]|uniref:glycerol-3-phosphate acyltransferase 1-like n=1 Tax=Vigna umbellata TaxID=87088 RepID=UPI001F5E3FE2|nr:glycerol-3-phosphate acyltransferase 1-like [Vigna umbellata]
MVSSMELLRLANWVMNQVLVKSCYGVARKIKSHGFDWGDLSYKALQQPSSFSDIVKCDLEGRGSQTLACDFHKVLLRTRSFFPYFMLVAFEGGSIFRAFLLLCSCPILWFLNYEMKLRLMIFISFCGLKVKDMENTSRAVLPKFYLENLNLEAYEVVASVGSRVFFSTMPRVMVEGFLKEYLNADAVIATELHTSGSYFTGFLSKSGFLVKHSALKDYFGDTKPDLGIGNTSLHDQLFISLCKEAYVVMNEGKVMPRNKYPKPLVFHDGRLAFLPTPSATLCMFMWLPIGLVMAIYRIFLGVFLCYKFTLALGMWCGLKLDFKDNNQKKSESDKGVLYVCTHRTLLDPIFLSSGLGRPLTAVTYSLSKVSECIAPIRTIRLTRDRKEDGETMKRLLGEGDLVVFPEGTTCREPYLLRFSSLFAELADEIVPVAVNVHLSMFYGTTASGLKVFDPFFFFMNPSPKYDIEILEKVPRELTCAGGRSSHEVANHIQKQLGYALGFECTNLTRRDKYIMLAGNEGVVQENKGRRI